MGQLQQTIEFALCIENRDCVDLEKGKVNQVLSDDNAAKEDYLRVVPLLSRNFNPGKLANLISERLLNQPPCHSKTKYRITVLTEKHRTTTWATGFFCDRMLYPLVR